jgi:hypothetical protein
VETSSTLRPTLAVYKEVVAGDLRKLTATSNDSKSGGGARDLRVPSRTFRTVMHKIFTENGTGRGGTAIRTADVIYLDSSKKWHKTRMEYWPPTSSRPNEDRIARIHQSPALGGRLPETNRGRVLVLFVLFDDHSVRVEYAYENQLRSNAWGFEITNAILGCMASTEDKNAGRRASLVPVQGYYDFESGAGYCHAD